MARLRLPHPYPSENLPKNIKHALDMMIVGVSFGMFMFTVTGGSPFSGFLTALGASDFFYGVINGLPVFAAVFQIYVSYRLERTQKRRKFFLLGGLVQRIVWIPIGLVPWLLPEGAVDLRLWSVLVLVTVGAFGGSFVNVTFPSWLGDTVPADIRGRYLASRNMISTGTALVTGLIMGWFLDNVPGWTGYTVLFCFSAIMGLLDIACFIKMYDPPMTKHDNLPKLKPLLRQAFSNKAFRRLLLFGTVFYFGLYIGNPYYNLYMINNMKMSFFEISLFGLIVGNITTILVVPYWGRFMDRHGYRNTLTIAGTIFAFLPFLFIFAGPGDVWVVIVINFVAGMSFCAIDLSIMSLYINISPTDGRSMYIAVYNSLINVFGLGLGAIFGGAFAEFMRPVAQSWNLSVFGLTLTNYHYVFMLSAVIRAFALIVLSRLIPAKSESK